VFTISIISIGASLHTWPHLRQIIRPSNESQLLPAIYVITEYFIDQEEYFYMMVLHAYTASCVGGFALLATGTMLLTYLQHICGMFSIAW